MTVEQFNKKYPVDTWVKFYPVKGINSFIETKIDSKCWQLDNGDLVVKIAGKLDEVSIDHIEAI